MKAIHVLLLLLAAWLLLSARQSGYQDVKQHSFELAGFKDGKHQLEHGNFYFYFKDPVNPSNFFTS